MRVQHDVDVALLSCNGSVLMASGERCDDYGNRLLRIVHAGQPNISVQSTTRLYGVIHRVRAVWWSSKHYVLATVNKGGYRVSL